MADDSSGLGFLRVPNRSGHRGSRSSGVQQSVEQFGWAVRVGLAFLLLVVLGILLWFRGPGLLDNSLGAASAAAILGVSIVFAAVLVPCSLLIVWRINDVLFTRTRLTELESLVEQGEAHAASIRSHAERIKARSL